MHEPMCEDNPPDSETSSENSRPFAMETPSPPSRPPKLLDQVRTRLRMLHYAQRTEEAYVGWIRRYILFHGKRHPADMGTTEVEAFLTALAVEGRVAASTQNQAMAAILFLYRHILGNPLGSIDALRAKRPKRLPVVLSR